MGATRGLLLIAQFLPQVLQKWTLDIGQNETFLQSLNREKKLAKMAPFLSSILQSHLSVYQSCLLNASLLCFFCLFFALLNNFFWGRAFKAERRQENNSGSLDNSDGRAPGSWP